MSTVIGIVSKKKIWIGSDSQLTSNDGHVRPVSCEKVFRNGNFLIGFAGVVRQGQLLKPEYFIAPQTIEEFPDFVRLHLAEFGCLRIDSEEGISMSSANYIVAYKNKLYEVLSDFQLGRVKQYSAIGSGSEFAYGSLFTTSKLDMNPIERIYIALETAAKFDISTGPPFKIFEY